MLSGVALALSEILLELIERHCLGRRIHDRGGEHEVQLLFADADHLLPVWRNGQLQILCWVNRRGESRHLPCTAWTQRGTIEDGGWAEHHVEPVMIPATMGLHGLVVLDEQRCSRVYVICEPTSHYYQIMTRGNCRMPQLIDEMI